MMSLRATATRACFLAFPLAVKRVKKAFMAGLKVLALMAAK